MSGRGRLDDLVRERGEWAPWLAVIGVALEEIGHRDWEAMSWEPGEPKRGAPALVRATVELEGRAVARSLCAVLDAIPRHARSTPPRSAVAARAAADPAAILEAAVNRDDERLARLAEAYGTEPEVFRAAAALAAMPLLHACGRRAQLDESWAEGYCPVCGGWPAFAEVLGVERSRILRCGGCAAAWQTSCLSCAYCGNADHERLGSYVAEADAAATIEVCNACRGYMKVFTSLVTTPASEIVLRDLATAELDVAAVQQGYRRAPCAAYRLDVSVVTRG